VRADVLDDHLAGKEASAKVARVWHVNTGNMAIHSPASVEDCIFERLTVLESLYQMALKTDQAWNEFTADYEEKSLRTGADDVQSPTVTRRPSRTTRLPREPELRSGIGDIGLSVRENLADFPTWCDEVLRLLVEERGLQDEKLDEEHAET
ncbi:unnamed protein product, partial [Prorocentrum cordatum]